MKSRISILIFLLLISFNSWAQIGGDYNPNNPTDPGNPTQEYTLTLKSTPTNGGSFNTSSTDLAGGKSYTLRAYPNTDFVFVAWICNGDTLSKSNTYTYTMPYHDVEIVGAFSYSPSSPLDPNVVTPKHKLTLFSFPSDGGSFNTSSATVFEGEKYNLRAYPNTDFAFLAWICNGDTLSKSVSYDFIMLNHDVDIVGVFIYRPSSPSDPQEQALKYQLSLSATPVNSGSFNISNERLAVGSITSLCAYSNTDFVFKHWMINDSVLSTNANLEYIMPSHDVQMIGVFEYNPDNPANPAKNYWNKETGEVIIDDFTPGSLSNAISSAISGSNRNDVKSIIVSGIVTNNDLGIANNYTQCSILDLSRVTGITDIPSYAFDYTNLETVILPHTIEKIGYEAFYQCTSLTALTVYAMTPPTLENYVFYGVPDGLVVYVPAAAIPQYEEAEGWKDFIILPIQEDIRNISVSLPSGTNVADFAQMWLELTNTKSGQRIHYVMTDRQTYTFANIIRNTSWKVTIRNERGDVFGQIDKVEVKDEDVAATFTSLSKPQTVSLVVLSPDGTDVTAKTQVTWLDAEGNYLTQSYSLASLPSGSSVSYRIILSQELAMQYVTPAVAEYVVNNTNNRVQIKLDPIKQVTLSGSVKDAATNMALNGAIITVSQTFDGKYNKTVSTKTDTKGNYTLTVSSVPTSLAFSASNYISQTIVCDTLMTGNDNISLPDVSLKSISGAVIALNLTYTKCPTEAGDEDTFQEWYADYNNITYSIYNQTKQKNINEFNVQYPQIVLLEEVEEDDVLQLTATSVTGAFMPVRSSATIDKNQHTEAVFNIVELGKIKATFAKNSNATVVGSLYDANGKLVKTYDYSNASLTINDLPDGSYTLVTMGSSKLFNSIYDLNQFSQTGLVRGTDYTQASANVQSGKVCAIDIDQVPTLNESKLYYTGENTSFTVNKSSIVAGNYLTLTGHLDFKSAYAGKVSNVNLIVDLPESCQFVENSVMVGNNTSNYVLNGQQISIPLTNYTERTRFCIIPTIGGEYVFSAMVRFDVNGETVTQPIGSSICQAKGLSIEVPAITSNRFVSISGAAKANSQVYIYDNDICFGQTIARQNGMWYYDMEIIDTLFNYSYHNIFAKVVEKNVTLQSENKTLIYHSTAVYPKSVDMVFGPYEITVDLEKSTNEKLTYTYPTCGKDFTFIINFSKNDSTAVSNVKVNVLCMDKSIKTLNAIFDKKMEKWVAYGYFPESYKLPINCNVEYECSIPYFDNSYRREIEYDNIEIALEAIEDYSENNVGVELLEDSESKVVFIASSPLSDTSWILSAEAIDRNGLNIDDSFTYIPEDDTYYKDNYTANNHYTMIIADHDSAFLLNLYRQEDFTANGLHRAPSFSDIIEFASDWLLPYEEFTRGLFDYNFWVNEHYPYIKSALHEEMMWTYDALSVTCPDGSPRLTRAQKDKFLDEELMFEDHVDAFYGCLDDLADLWGMKLRNAFIYESETLLFSKFLKAIPNAQFFKSNGKGSGLMRYVVKGGKQRREWTKDFIERSFETLLETLEAYGDWMDFTDFESISQEFQDYLHGGYDKYRKRSAELRSNIRSAYKKCTQDPDPNPENDEFPNNNIEPYIDPSGYVYEAISSNRLQGVTATAFYKEYVEDMYGDLHENIVKWDAQAYAQENPLFTDEFGMYAWDVPQGLWQVKFEKEGYETTYSEWLPVPPPQLDVNIGMKQNRQPEVKMAHAYEDAVEVEFDKYMMPELLTTDNIIVMQGNKQVAGAVELINEEISCEGSDETFASKIRFNAPAPFTEQEVTLIVNNRVKSYAGIRMQDNFQQTFAVEKEVKQIVCDSLTVIAYGQEASLIVSVLPAAASCGKTLTVQTSSSMILGIESDQIVIDQNGKAEICFTGYLPGVAGLTFSIEGTDKTASAIVKVIQPSTGIAVPKASILSGSVIAKGTSVALSCATADATIYYTLDGSCPCDEDSRLVYTGPIIVDRDLTIKAMAIGPDGKESEIAEFSYYVEDSGIENIFEDSTIQIYPSPVKDYLTVNARGQKLQVITLTSMNGMKTIFDNLSSEQTSIDVRALPSGPYVIEVITDSKRVNQIVIKK